MMALDRDPNMPDRDPARDPGMYEPEKRVYDRSTGSSNFMAFLIGGIVIAIGLLAFLFYDGRGDEPSTTSSVPSVEAPATPTPPPSRTPAEPSAPSPAPANPSAPAPANPQ